MLKFRSHILVVETYLKNTFTYAVMPISRELLLMQVFIIYAIHNDLLFHDNPRVDGVYQCRCL